MYVLTNVKLMCSLGPKNVGRVIKSGVLANRNTELELKELKEFALEYEGQFGSGERSVKQAIERAQTNVQWMNKNYEAIAEWFNNHSKTLL